MTIKFRGIAEDGKHIFSDSIQFDVDNKGREFCRLKDEFGNWLYVDPDSIARFVGYDADGKEVYESDKVLSPDNFIVDVLDMLLEPDDLKRFKLYKNKERGENENLS